MSAPDKASSDDDLTDLGEFPPGQDDIDLWVDRDGRYLTAIETRMRERARRNNTR